MEHPGRMAMMDAKEGDCMKRAESTNIPVHDYRQALKNAVSWLGDRYLLAEPVRRHEADSRSYYVESRRWHDLARRHAQA